MKTLWRLFKDTIFLFLGAPLLWSCGTIKDRSEQMFGHKSKSDQRTEFKNPLLPSEEEPTFSFYKGESRKSKIIGQPDLEKTFNVLGRAQPGRVQKLEYKRLSEIEEGSTWDQLSKTLAPTYGAALDMLRDLGVNAPVLISVSLIDGYLKHQNDLWYAALEKALDQRLPDPDLHFGRGKITALLLADMNQSGLSTPQLTGALTAHQNIVTAPQSMLEDLWKKDPFQFKPISFYSSDPTLQRLWTSDRLLLANKLLGSGEEISAFNAWWKENKGQGKAGLTSLKGVFAKVTNQIDPAIFADGGFAEIINNLRNVYQCDGNSCGSFWAPSSPGILERLPHGERDQYDSEAKAQPPMDKIVQSIKAGALTLKPTPKDGFFIYQRFALEPLLRQNGLAEAQILSLDAKMQDLWTEVYKAGTAKALETHQKVIDTGGPMIDSASLEPQYERLLLEPLPTAYKRYAQGYSMLHDYIKTLPAEFIAHWMVEGRPITEHIAKLESQMFGLYLVSSRQLGLKIDSDVEERMARWGETVLLGKAQDFLANLNNEAAMSEDQRFMAVQGRPGGPKVRGCEGKPAVFWTTLGIEAVPVQVKGVIQEQGEDAEDSSADRQRFYRNEYVFTENMVILVDHFAEITECVDAPLTRSEWRNLLQKSSDLRQAVQSLKAEF